MTMWMKNKMSEANNQALVSVLIFLLLLSLSTFNIQTSRAQSEDLKVYVIGDTTHEISLRASQMSNGQVIPVSNFVIAPESVVQIKQGQNLIVNASNDEIEKVKVTNAKGVTTELLPLENSQYSASKLDTGIYILNVIVTMPSQSQSFGDKGAYETILVVLAPDQKPIQKTEITKIVQKTSVDVKIIFKDNDKDDDNGKDGDNDNGCSNEPGSAKMGFPYQRRTQCEVEEWDDCKKIPVSEWDAKCATARERFSDDCEGFKNKEECDAFYQDQTPPPCDDNTTEGVTCTDEGDSVSCEEGLADLGNGCVPIEEEETPSNDSNDDDNTPAETEAQGNNTDSQETESEE
jgi:hypothetical protein